MCPPGLYGERESGMKKVLVFLTLTIVLLICSVSCIGQTKHTHNFGEWSTTKNPTCIEDGVKTRYCDCGEKQSDVIPAINHNYVDGVCSNCGDVYTEIFGKCFIKFVICSLHCAIF